MTPANSIRSLLESGRAAIAEEFRQSTDGIRACTAQTALMDRVLASAFDGLSAGARQDVAIIALGGYGRGELFPHSDVDVMVLIHSGEHQNRAAETARTYLHQLWDTGLNVGHSVRTVDEALALYGQTLDAWVAMLEGRFLCGNRELADRLFRAMREKIGQPRDTWLPGFLFEESAARQSRFGSSVKLLEPHVKKSAGGLRDIHTIFWLYRGVKPALFAPIDPSVPATLALLNRLHDEGILEEDVHAAADAALRFLFRVRTAMHVQRNAPHDTLEYALQRDVAEMLGYRQRTELLSVEVFMRDYYLHARAVHTLYHRLGQQFWELLEPPRRLWNRGRRVGSMFRLKDGTIVLDKPAHALERVEQVFEVFGLAAEFEADLGIGLRTAIERSCDLVTPESILSAECKAMMRRIFMSRRVAATLRDMNDVNVLGRIIPEFGELVAFFQHNVYHYYTADEHTLIALAHAEALRDEQGFLHEVHRKLRWRELLYLAVLLHDIAKPRGVAHHEMTGVPMAQEIVRRVGFGDLADDVGFLVRHHLLMEQIAFRRNVNDPETIKEFASRFEKPYQIDYLYLLTYADLSAVNPGVWTDWKAAMLRELYQRTAEVLHRHLRGAQVDRYHEERQEAAEDQVVAALRPQFEPAVVRSHLDAIPNGAYTSVFTPDDIAQHIRLGEQPGPAETLCAAAGSSTDVTIVARDAPFALSKFCAVLSANDATIFSADVFTRDDGIIIDRFRVSDAATGKELTPKTCTKITDDLRNVMAGSLDIAHLFAEHHRKWKRRPRKPVNPTTRTDVQFEDTSRFTIIDVYAPDSVGFLYRVTETMSTLGLNIYFAKIATRVDGIVDAFYVLDRTGHPLESPERKEEVRAGILSTIGSMAERELAGDSESGGRKQ